MTVAVTDIGTPPGAAAGTPPGAATCPCLPGQGKQGHVACNDKVVCNFAPSLLNYMTLHATALALSFSTAEYAFPAWERSTHAKKLDPALNESCRCITGCLKPTNTNDLYILPDIAPSEEQWPAG